jgi:hypothetical protein
VQTARNAVRDLGELNPTIEADGEHFLLRPRDGSNLGEVLALLVDAGIELLACREERSVVEEAFIRLTAEEIE